jgi:hypothetical protein
VASVTADNLRGRPRVQARVTSELAVECLQLPGSLNERRDGGLAEPEAESDLAAQQFYLRLLDLGGGPFPRRPATDVRQRSRPPAA